MPFFSTWGDDWLDITSQDLERMLQDRCGITADVGSQTSSSGKRTNHVNGKEESETKDTDDSPGYEEEAGYSLVAVSKGMKDFLNAVSSHEGAEFPWWDPLLWFHQLQSQGWKSQAQLGPKNMLLHNFYFHFDLKGQLISAFYTWSRRNVQGIGQTFGYEGRFMLFKTKIITNSYPSHLFYHFILLGKQEEELDSDDLDDDDYDDNDDENDGAAEESLGRAEMTEAESLKGLRGYMEQMDQELMGTNVGQSFKLAVGNLSCHCKTLGK